MTLPARAALAALLLAAPLLPAPPALAQDAAPGSTLNAPPEAYVDGRQSQMAAMQELGTHIDLGAAAATDDAFYQLLEEGEALAGILHGVGLLFPEGTSPDDLTGIVTHASPAIWEDRARFDELLLASRAAADGLILSEDGPDLLARFEALEETCTACHAEFLAYDPFEGLEGAPAPDEAIFDFGGGGEGAATGG